MKYHMENPDSCKLFPILQLKKKRRNLNIQLCEGGHVCVEKQQQTHVCLQASVKMSSMILSPHRI